MDKKILTATILATAFAVFVFTEVMKIENSDAKGLLGFAIILGIGALWFSSFNTRNSK